jgi:hypothetical protein
MILNQALLNSFPISAITLSYSLGLLDKAEARFGHSPSAELNTAARQQGR